MSARRARWTLIGLLALLPALVLLAIAVGEAAPRGIAAASRGVLALLGVGEALPPVAQQIVELRLWRACLAAAAGGSLALAGGLLQGLLRNALASPSVLGVTSGASLGATLAVTLVGGYGPQGLVAAARGAPLAVVPAAAFAGAGLVCVAIWIIGQRSQSTSTLLLCGIAIATLCGGAEQVLQGAMLRRDFEVAVAISQFSLGNLDDKTGWHVLPVAAAMTLGLMALPLLCRELDLLALGEEDARTLGLSPGRLVALVVVLASVLTGASIAIAGHITFVGLIVPNLLRLWLGGRHTALLPASALAGGAFLLLVDTLNRTWLSELGLQPGVLLSVLGAPWFLWLLWRQRKEGLWW